MQRTAQQLRDEALQIWWAGVEAVQPQRLIPESVRIEGTTLWIADHDLDLNRFDRITVVGCGKASGAMAVALEQVLGGNLMRSKQVQGWVNVPEDCVVPTQAVHLYAARPAGVNEPRPEGVAGTEQILRLVEQLGPRDLCLCLISGGGSALLPMPIEGVSLDHKIALTREIAARGGDIGQLNTVRREISRVKGGGLARHCRAAMLVSLTLSDVIGDDLEIIASGPTVPRESTPDQALGVLQDLELLDTEAGRVVRKALERCSASRQTQLPSTQPVNIVLANNSTAVDSAGMLAERLGYSHAMLSGDPEEGTAESVGRWLAKTATSMRDAPGPDCLISGGETTVQLAPEGQRGKGGRNQQLALAALQEISDWSDLALVSGGTDGEDGPTDAAGAQVDEEVVARGLAAGLDPEDFLRRNDAYEFFRQADGLLKTGPTGTNVCDLRVLCVSKDESPETAG